MPQSQPDRFTALREKFPAEVVKQRPGKGGQKLDYIAIDATLNRLNDVLGTDWSTRLLELNVYPTDSRWSVIIALELSALDKVAVGVGAGEDSDPDNAVKTALAEAIKKAGHQFGIGLELWDEAWRDEIAASRGAVTVAVDSQVTNTLRRSRAR